MKINHFINGTEWRGGDARVGVVTNPATGDVSKEVNFASEEDVTIAVEAASNALPDWAATPPARRVRIMLEYYRLLNENRRNIAELITEEHGKTIDDALGEVQRGLEVVEYSLAATEFLKGQHSESVGRGVDTKSIRFPLGVVAGITPFNFPAMVPMWMFPMAIICGNTFILKPSEKVPSASMLLAELASKAGFPPGVLNVVNGDKTVVDALLHNDEVQAVSFVGSTPVAKYIYSTASANGKRVQALGGAKNHMIIMPDANMDVAVNGLMGAAYGSAGERCMAISVAVAVGDKTADDLIERLVPKVNALRIGDGATADKDMGPLITADHRAKVARYIDAGVEEGANLVVDGRERMNTDDTDGFFIGGSLFDNVTPSMKIYQEEIFGPVLCVVRVESYADAVELINNHEFGNGGAIFTRSGQIAQDFYARVKCGMVGVNVPIPVPVAYHSFGGWKASLFGDHHMHGPEGVRFYTRLKTITTRWPEIVDAGSEFTMPVL